MDAPDHLKQSGFGLEMMMNLILTAPLHNLRHKLWSTKPGYLSFNEDNIAEVVEMCDEYQKLGGHATRFAPPLSFRLELLQFPVWRTVPPLETIRKQARTRRTEVRPKEVIIVVRERAVGFQSEPCVEKSPPCQQGRAYVILLARRCERESYVFEWKLQHTGAIRSGFCIKYTRYNWSF